MIHKYFHFLFIFIIILWSLFSYISPRVVFTISSKQNKHDYKLTLVYRSLYVIFYTQKAAQPKLSGFHHSIQNYM